MNFFFLLHMQILIALKTLFVSKKKYVFRRGPDICTNSSQLISLQRSALMRETRGDCHSRMRIGRNCSIILFVLVLIDYCEVGIQKQIVRSFKVVY